MIEYKGFINYVDIDEVSVYRTDNFSELPICVQESLGNELVEVAARGFQRPVNKEFRDDVFEHLRGGDLLVAVSEGVAKGFAIRRQIPEIRAVYLAGAVKLPNFSSKIIEYITQKYIDEHKPEVVITRTQNDRVVEGMMSLCDEVIPIDRIASPQEINILKGASLLPESLKFDPKYLIINGFYGGQMVSGERRRCNNPKIVALTDRLNYEQGDAVLLIGYRRKK